MIQNKYNEDAFLRVPTCEDSNVLMGNGRVNSTKLGRTGRVNS